MKQFFLLVALALFVGIEAGAQTDTLRQKAIQQSPKTTISPTTKPASMRVATERNLSTMPADLRFSELTVTATPTGVPDTYNLTVTWAVKNDGGTAVLADDITINTYVSNEDWLTIGQKDLRFTRFLRPAGGETLSNISGRGETLAPRASKRRAFTIYNQVILPSPKPIFVVHVSTGAKEGDASNNIAYTYIII